MAKGYQGIALRHLDTLFRLGTVGELTDAQLLERYASQRDDAAELAFTALVERHGPMVLRVCRAVLGDSHDVHDAFQATFLVLVRSAGSLWVRDSLGPWLHQVAHRTASYARSAAARRRRHEGRAAGSLVRSAEYNDCEDLTGVVHQEVGRLPERYRAAVMLCLIEGLTPEQAARHLTCPVGTVHSRLARGRARLRDRLTRRGLDLSVSTPGALLASQTAPALVPTALVEATVRVAVRIAFGSESAGTVPAVSVTLSRAVLRSMLMARLTTVAASLLLFGVISTGVTVRGQQGSTDNPGPAKGVGIQAPGRAEGAGRELPAGDLRKSEGYAAAKSLREAVQIARRPLADDRAKDHPYDALLILLTEERVRQAIPSAMKGYESDEERHPDAHPATSRDYYRSSIKPRLSKIAKEGAWPPDSYFTYFPTMYEKNGITYGGFSLQLVIGTPGEKYLYFALPLISVVFGSGEVVND